MLIVRDIAKSSTASLGALFLSFFCVEFLLPALEDNISSRLTLVLFLSLMFQTVLVRYIPALYQHEIYTYSEGLAEYEVVQILSGRFGPFLTGFLIYFSNYFIGFFLVCLAMFSGILKFDVATLVLLSLTLAFMLDPIIAFILRSHESISLIIYNTGPVLMGYIAVLLIGIGAIPVQVIESGYYPYLLSFCWMSARMAFITNFAFDRKQDILVFGPSIMALFAAVVPNLILVTNQL